MNRYRYFWGILISIFFGGMIYSRMNQPSSMIHPSDLAIFQKVLPQAQTVVKNSGPLPYYKIFKPNPQTGLQELTGYAFFTSEIAPEIEGYAGVINILVGLNPQGVIQGLYLISSAETSNYVGELDAFLKQFVSLGPKNDLALGKDIDGITGSTITSQAITQSINKSLTLILADIGQAAPSPQAAARIELPRMQIVFPFFLFFLAALTFLKQQDILRSSALLFSLIYLGFWQKTMVSSVQFANISLLKFPPFAVTPIWHILIGLTVVTSILWGRLYCGSVCPFAAVQEIIYLFGQKVLRLKRQRPDEPSDHSAKIIKYIILVGVILASLIIGNAQPAQVEVYLTFFTRHATLLGWALLTLILIISLFHQRFWCKYLCPTGALLALCAYFSPNKIKIHHCVNCQQCAKICPTSAINIIDDKPVIDYPECIMCHQCLKNCPTINALKKP